MTPISDSFQMPTQMKITGRSSSITAAFVTAIVPKIEPTVEEIRKALTILEMSPDSMECAYCGGSYSEWDHLRPLVSEKEPTGYITEIRNLVPSCGKCNQSKGNKEWRVWIVSDAKLSPKMRGTKDLEIRIVRLTRYEQWGDVIQYDFHTLVSKSDWDEHWTNRDNLLLAMIKAQKHAERVKSEIQEKTKGLASSLIKRPPKLSA